MKFERELRRCRNEIIIDIGMFFFILHHIRESFLNVLAVLSSTWWLHGQAYEQPHYMVGLLFYIDCYKPLRTQTVGKSSECSHCGGLCGTTGGMRDGLSVWWMVGRGTVEEVCYSR